MRRVETIKANGTSRPAGSGPAWPESSKAIGAWTDCHVSIRICGDPSLIPELDTIQDVFQSYGYSVTASNSLDEAFQPPQPTEVPKGQSPPRLILLIHFPSFVLSATDGIRYHGLLHAYADFKRQMSEIGVRTNLILFSYPNLVPFIGAGYLPRTAFVKQDPAVLLEYVRLTLKGKIDDERRPICRTNARTAAEEH